MGVSMSYRIKIKPLTQLWTGDEERKSGVLRETGIIGSLRWWYEALIRSLDGTACDPTNNRKERCEGKNHCDACELFGCSGWARKFKLDIKKSDDEVIFKIIELKEMDDIEFGLLNKTFKIIEDYGALGGKLAERNYGIIKIEENGLEKFQPKKNKIKKYIKKGGSTVDDPNFKRFVFIKKGLNLQFVKKLKEECTFLKGKPGKGKRYFYKTLNNKPYRLFIQVKDDEEYKEVLNFVKKHNVEFIEGKELLEGLL
ncbi:type III-B CRISPR module RAMP protein Cmr1 [Candidatus Bipolaricaulota bacterium]|nr:type III-B CRISPR module RAMP protein Cmr1 [Candidatus Bipolaricaulota bacterium]